jgi:hypothetical protein
MFFARAGWAVIVSLGNSSIGHWRNSVLSVGLQLCRSLRRSQNSRWLERQDTSHPSRSCGPRPCSRTCRKGRRCSRSCRQSAPTELVFVVHRSDARFQEQMGIGDGHARSHGGSQVVMSIVRCMRVLGIVNVADIDAHAGASAHTQTNIHIRSIRHSVCCCHSQSTLTFQQAHITTRATSTIDFHRRSTEYTHRRGSSCASSVIQDSKPCFEGGQHLSSSRGLLR